MNACFPSFFSRTEKFSVIRAMCNPLAVEDQVLTNILGTSSAWGRRSSVLFACQAANWYGGAPGSRERVIIRCPLHSVVLFKFSKCSGAHRSVSHAAVVVAAAQRAFSTGRSSQSNIFHCQFFFTDNPWLRFSSAAECDVSSITEMMFLEFNFTSDMPPLRM